MASNKFTGDFTINDVENVSAQYEKETKVKQVPVSLAMKGPPSIRNRSVAYGVSKGSDPATIIQEES